MPLAVVLETALRGLPALGFRGCNLTIPHKQAAMAIVDRVDPLARRIGAVNTIIVAADGTLEARNTDAYGFRENLRDNAPDWDPAAGPAIVLGAGGAARAVIAALIEDGVGEIRLVNRTLARAEPIANELAEPQSKISVHRWNAREDVLADGGILVNTKFGMTGEPGLDTGTVAQHAVVVDIVYVPLDTSLLVEARRRGHRTGWARHAAAPRPAGVRGWFGTPVRVTCELRAAVLTTLTGSPPPYASAGGGGKGGGG